VYDGTILADFSAELGAISAPALGVWGERDEMVDRAERDALVAAIPDARALVYAGAGHAPHWEQPARVAGDLVAFARRGAPAVS
jgi:non-heme chloroperoxidase